MEEEKIVAEANEIVEETPSEDIEGEISAEKKRSRFLEWWDSHKITKRRIIQVYAALLYNANIKGYIKGEIFTGVTKTVCVPGLNCYSCPGAIGACPLGSLQNALAGANKRMPYYILGIILLYGLILGRMICGFLCPVGLAQDLLYKIKTPKLEKSRVTRILSYFKYVILAVLVIGIPLIYAIDRIAVPGFCKYICPAGTFGGAFMLLINPNNDSMYAMLGELFTWKTAVLFAVIAACIFIYRAFCRFLCPLGAIYGFFNRFSLLGIKVDDNKCIKCGKCVKTCKTDIKKVGDHECINCGECRDVCPTKAISFKGSKIFVDNLDPSLKPCATEEKAAVAAETTAVVQNDIPACKSLTSKSLPLKKSKAFWVRLTAIVLMVALFVGVFTYINFFADEKAEAEQELFDTYIMEVNDSAAVFGKNTLVSFILGDKESYVNVTSGSGTQDDPYIVENPEGKYESVIGKENASVYYKFTLGSPAEYAVNGSESLDLRIYLEANDRTYAAYDYQVDGKTFSATLKIPEKYGNGVGFICYDFTLSDSIGEGSTTLSDYRGSVVVVNFWATWCGPCVKELPDFEKIRKENEGVEVIAVHSANVTENVENFIMKEWGDWGVRFVQDSGTAAKSEVYDLLGGRNGAYPRTLVLDKNGVVRYVFESSVDEEKLSNAVKSCLAE